MTAPVTHRALNWGGYPAQAQRMQEIAWPSDLGPAMLDAMPPGALILAHGNGRSQGDVGLNRDGVLLNMRACNRLLAFDATTGLLTVEAGATLHEILAFAAPRGWMLPVVPGTRFVTVGGAIANDIHGKNHHAPGPAHGGWGGSFGHHVVALDLWRTDAPMQTLKPGDRLFHATVGGLGLTGVIVRAQLRLRPLGSGVLARRIVPLRSLADFFEAMATHGPGHEFSVAWIDLLAPDNALGRGYVELANWLDAGDGVLPAPTLPAVAVPFPLPFNAVNPFAVRAFNTLWRMRPRRREAVVDYRAFFWPLDGIGNWRNLYGPAQFLQCQVVIPHEVAEGALVKIIRLLRTQGRPTFLNTLKYLGGHPPVGWCSFPRAGVTLAVDLLMEGTPTLHLLRQVEDIVLLAGGAIYPAKDSALSARGFQRMFPHWTRLAEVKDPHMHSDFWARVSAVDNYT